MATKKPTKASRQAQTQREAMRLKRLATAKRKKRNRLIAVLGSIVILALVVVLIVVLVNRQSTTTPSGSPTDSSTEQATSGATATSTVTATANQVNPPDGDTQRAWIRMPSTNTKADALRVDMHADYQCPYCKQAETNYATMFEDLNANGDIIFNVHTRTGLDGIGNQTIAMSTRAAVAAACVDVADSSKYPLYNNTIYDNQPSTEGPGYTDDQLRVQFAAKVGLTGSALTTFQNCYDTQATLKWVQDVEKNNVTAALDSTGNPKYLFGGNTPFTDTTGNVTGTQGATIGVASFPTFFINGKEATLANLFNNDWTPKAKDEASLLALLQQIAAS